MNRTTLPLSEIIVPERFRRDYGDLTFIKESITRYGLIQPIVVNQEKVLVAGGRRFRCHEELKLSIIDVVYKETLTESDRLDMEALENIARKAFTWQEEAVAILRINNRRRLEAALVGSDWNTRLACELFGISKGALGYVLEVARKLEAELKLPEDKRPYHEFNSCAEAYRVGILGELEAKTLAAMAKKHQALAAKLPIAVPVVSSEALLEQRAIIQEVTAAQSSPDILADVKERYYSNPHNKPDSFEAYWNSRQAQKVEFENIVHLSNRLRHESCIDHMQNNPNTYHHIITDIPYGIEMDMLDQDNVTDVDRVKEAHDVEENMDLMALFFPAAFSATKERSFVITYCDIMQWGYMYDLATSAGFRVQRWPIIWHKQSGAGNQAASYNSTKNYEPIMVCRKPSATLVHPISSSIILASAESAKADCKHPFSKPYDITRILADAISNKGDVFLEPFAGGGSISTELTRQERNVVSCEKDDHHYAQLIESYKQFYLKLNPHTVFK